MIFGRELHRTDFDEKNVLIIGGNRQFEKFDMSKKIFKKINSSENNLLGFGMSQINKNIYTFGGGFDQSKI